jgi:hypothetical protein
MIHPQRRRTAKQQPHFRADEMSFNCLCWRGSFERNKKEHTRTQKKTQINYE